METNNRGQAEGLSTVLLVAIIVIVTIVAYIWGTGLFESQKSRSTVDYMTAKLFETKSAILAVTHDGLNSSRIIQVDVPVGNLLVTGGSFCSSGNMSGNSIAFNLSVPKKLVDSETWVSIDPTESNSSCDALFENSSAAVLIGKAEKVGNSYVNSYTLWFRNLTQQNGATNNFFVINITPGESTTAAGGGHRIIVRNTGTSNSSYTIYTTIQVDIL